MKTLSVKVKKSKIIEQVCAATDYDFDGSVVTEIPSFRLPTDSFSIGLLLGKSGSGKSTLLSEIGESFTPTWELNKAVCDHFSSFEAAREMLGATGLNSIPTWLRPYRTLSNGEKYRADLARQLQSGAVIDEFTSVVDRHVAASCATAISKFVRRKKLSSIVFASCHYDIASWLEPDWVFDCSVGKMTDRGSLRRPTIAVKLVPAEPQAWTQFREHHYLTGKINRSARCWLAIWEGIAVGFTSAIAFPNGNIKNAWREHRTVILPEFQGMGIGSSISDAVGEIFIRQGCHYFSKTAHPTFGLYREKSSRWIATSKNRKSRPDYSAGRKTKEDGHKMRHVNRVCFSHEYVGPEK